MADFVYLERYERHCLDKLVNTSTEARLIEEGHVFKLTDGTEYVREGNRILTVEEENPV